MALVRGPFELKWGDNVLTDIEEIEFEQTVDSEDYQTLEGRTIEVDGPYKTTATLTLLGADIQALAALLPQHFVANGGIMSTGETVNTAVGAIDVAPHACDEELIYNNFDIIACGAPGQVTRIVHARTKLDGIEIDNKVMKVMIKIVGEATAEEGTVQMFKENSINVVS